MGKGMTILYLLGIMFSLQYFSSGWQLRMFFKRERKKRMWREDSIIFSAV
jgi:hypothetical protein